MERKLSLIRRVESDCALAGRHNQVTRSRMIIRHFIMCYWAFGIANFIVRPWRNTVITEREKLVTVTKRKMKLDPYRNQRRIQVYARLYRRTVVEHTMRIDR